MRKKQNNCIIILMSHTSRSYDHYDVHRNPQRAPSWGSCNQSSPLHITDEKYYPLLSIVELICEKWLRNGHEREKGTRISFSKGKVARACIQPIITIYCKYVWSYNSLPHTSLWYGAELSSGTNHVMKVSRIKSMIQIQHTILILLLTVPSSRGEGGCGHAKFFQIVPHQ
jgi:hypothetical protein